VGRRSFCGKLGFFVNWVKREGGAGPVPARPERKGSHGGMNAARTDPKPCMKTLFFRLLNKPTFSPYGRADLTASALLQPARRRPATPSQAASSPPRQSRLAHDLGLPGDWSRDRTLRPLKTTEKDGGRIIGVRTRLAKGFTRARKAEADAA
jgi:hypothetical protein